MSERSELIVYVMLIHDDSCWSFKVLTWKARPSLSKLALFAFQDDGSFWMSFEDARVEVSSFWVSEKLQVHWDEQLIEPLKPPHKAGAGVKDGKQHRIPAGLHLLLPICDRLPDWQHAHS